MEGSSEKKGFWGKVAEGGRVLWRSVSLEVPKIDLEKIGEQIVADVIENDLGNPLQKMLGKGRWVNLFSIANVLTYLGYGAVWAETDFQEKYPKEYAKTRSALWNLSRLGILDTVTASDPDPNFEQVLYKVVNPGLLHTIAEEGIQKPQSVESIDFHPTK